MVVKKTTGLRFEAEYIFQALPIFGMMLFLFHVGTHGSCVRFFST